MRRRVVVTGLGCVTPLGAGAREFWDRLLRGESGAGRITLFDAGKFPVRIAAEVHDWDLSDAGEDPQPWRWASRQTQFAVGAALKAAHSAGLAPGAVEPLRMGVFLGCGELFPDFDKFCQLVGASVKEGVLDLDQLVAESHRVYQAEQDLDPGRAASCIAGLFDAQGPNANFTAACVSSSMAIGEAAELIRSGDQDVMLCGGAHSLIHPFGLTGFTRLSTLSTHNENPQTAMRPFDRDRDGFVMGEGGVVLVLEELEYARQRDADIWAEFKGWSATHDAYRITDLDPEGRAACRCIKLALDDARLCPEDIDYINAHGTATVMNDKTETLTTKLAMGSCAYHIPMSGTKAMTGHLTTACGAIEAAVCLLAIRHGAVPPTINYETPDPDCDLDYVPNTARDVACKHVMSNNFGFGGHNTSLIFSRFDG